MSIQNLCCPVEVICRKDESLGANVMQAGKVCGQANNNPIINTGTYLVQFYYGEVTKLTSNVIATQMYAQYEPDGNMYVMLDDFTDHHESSKALSIEDQKATDIRVCNVMRRSTAGWQFFSNGRMEVHPGRSFVTLNNPTQ